jgi:hypothetical protein
MTKEEFASKLDGREYGDEMTTDERKLAKSLGLVVVYGYSDDSVEFEGAIEDEVGAYDGGTVLITREGVLLAHDNCDCDYCGYNSVAEKAAEIEAVWGEGDYSWQMRTTLPHATFEILEDGEKFCRGLVISLSDIPSGK